MISSEMAGLKKDLEKKLFCWNSFNFSPTMRGFFLNLVDPLMKNDGYLVSLVRAEEISPQIHAGNSSVALNLVDNLEIKLSSSEKEKVKRIQEFICSRYKISTPTFLEELKKKSRDKSVIRENQHLDDSLVGEYFKSHVMKNSMKSIKLFNMNTLRDNRGDLSLRIPKAESMSLVRPDKERPVLPVSSFNPTNQGLNANVLERINGMVGRSSDLDITNNILSRANTDDDRPIKIDVDFRHAGRHSRHLGQQGLEHFGRDFRGEEVQVYIRDVQRAGNRTGLLDLKQDLRQLPH